jgi:hypothetical protein
MTVPVQTPTQSSTANGVTTSFPYAFTILLASDLVVEGVFGAITTTYTYGVDYTLTGVGTAAGSVEFAISPVNGTLITRYRDLQLKRDTDYQNNGDLLTDTLDSDFDRVWMALQDNDQAGNLALRVPESGGVTVLPVAALRADRMPAFNAAGDAIVTPFTATQLSSAIASAYAAGTTADAIIYLSAGPGAAPISLQAYLRLGLTFPESCGAIGDGAYHPLSGFFSTLVAAQAVYGAAAAVALSDDIDGVVIQSMLNNGIQVQLRAGGRYQTTRGIQLLTGSTLIGAKRWAAAASTMKYVGTSTLTYSGAGGANSYVVLASTQPVGILPTDTSTRALQNCTCRNFTIDGNDTAWYPLIEIRAAEGNDFSDLTITNGRVCHNVMELGFVTGSDRRMIFLGRGAGLWSGKDVWSWAVTTTDDQISMKDWFVNYIGCDQSANPLNQFVDSGGSAPTSSTTDVECGMSIYGARAIRFINCQISQCSGIAFVAQPTLTGPIVVDGGYMEFNGRSSGASQHWSTWTNTVVGSGPVIFREVSFSGTAPAHRITGTAPSRVERGVLFENCPLMGTVFADHSNWNAVRCDQTMVVTGSAPQSAIFTPAGVQFGVATGDARLSVYREGVTGAVALAGATVAGTGWTYNASNTFLHWTRVGRQVTFGGKITLTAKSGTATGGILITGLPFNVKTGQGYNSAIATSAVSTLTSTVVSLTGQVVQASTTIALYLRTAAAASETAVALADLANTTSFSFSGSYVTDDA